MSPLISFILSSVCNRATTKRDEAMKYVGKTAKVVKDMKSAVMDKMESSEPDVSFKYFFLLKL